MSFMHLRLLQQLFGLWIHNTLDFLIVGEVLLVAGVLVQLESLLVQVEFRLATSDVVDLDGLCVETSTVISCCAWIERRMAAKC